MTLSEKKQSFWNELVHSEGQPIPNLPLVDGRFDLRGLNIAAPEVVEEIPSPVPGVRLHKLQNITQIKGKKCKSLDFSNSKLPQMRFFDNEFEDCLFNNCNLSGLRIWKTDFVSTSFVSANLNGSGLSGVKDGAVNLFENVDFSNANMRDVSLSSGKIIDCRFENTRLSKINLGSTYFERCVFKGEFHEIIFNKKSEGNLCPDNEMIGVDFRQASLRWCDFRNLKLDKVLFPEDGNHLIIPKYMSALDHLISTFEKKETMGARRFTAVMQNRRKWVDSDEAIGLLNKLDIIEMGGEEGLEWFLDTLGKFSSSYH